LDKISHLLRKHQVKTEEELLKIKTELEATLQNFSSLETQITKTEKAVKEQQVTCLKLAKELSAARGKSLSALEKEVMSVLHNLSMENAQFKVDLQQQTELGSGGIDQLRFLFSANKGVALNDLSKMASGGELSRLMLSLKAIMAEKKQLPTIIFDEIDTGVSGDVAEKIGSILLKMGASLQVITITHLPQMASKGSHHLFVYKNDNEEQTVSHIRQLNKDERITEIAKMLSTSNPTQSALKNARDLLSLN
jgi:DNA repair protein RecN (Recombination protein N)